MTSILFRGSQIVVDVLVLSAAYWLAYFLRHGLEVEHSHVKLFFFTWPYVVLFQYLVLAIYGVPRFAWRYVNLRDAQWVVAALLTSNLVLAIVRGAGEIIGGYARFVMIPYGVLLMDLFIAVAGILGVRAMRRVSVEQRDRRRRASPDGSLCTMTLLVGAGQAGVMVARELAARPDLGVRPIGFVDDDPLKQGARIQGLKVLGSLEHLSEIARARRITHALITIANAEGGAMRRILRLCQEAGLHTKIIPGIYEIVGGQVNLSRIRDVAIDDLLGREPVHLDDTAIAGVVQERCVMVTGAGGSIGSELCRQVCRFGPAKLVLVEKSENSLFEIHRELEAAFPSIELVPVLADICDHRRVDCCFAQHRPAVVFHAAAHKHVPLVEWNPGEAIKNNVLGTRVVADAAHAHGTCEFVMISTDKAVNPSSVMGATKRVAEMYVQAISQRSKTKFVAVRFGNVLGSAGSVVPIFKQQIARGGPVTVTDPDMRRYFMTIPEACQLVLQAASMGHGGEIFVLDMGEPVRIVDLARDLISLSGLRPGEDIEIVFTGVRPGEKLFEELATDTEKASKTRHPKIFIGRIAPQDWSRVVLGLKSLASVADEVDPEDVRTALAEVVSEYQGGPKTVRAASGL